MLGGLISAWQRWRDKGPRYETAPDAVVRLMHHRPEWASLFRREDETIRCALGDIPCFADHVGSSSVAKFVAKPIVDILVTLRSPTDFQAAIEVLVAAGYELAEREETEARAFLTRAFDDPACEGVNIHLVLPDSDYGLHMQIFRDALAEDAALRSEYQSLKIELAGRFPSDQAAYTAGKGEFIARILRQETGALGIDRLLTHQRAELDRSQLLHLAVLSLQVAIAGVAAYSVLVSAVRPLFDLALASFLLAALWLWLARKQRAHRGAGDAARRSVLIASGLGRPLSREQRLRIFDNFSVRLRPGVRVREEDYFSSRSAPGLQRLAEHVQESAYWTRRLQGASATFLYIAIAAIISVAGLFAWQTLPLLDTDAQVDLARIIIALFVFLLSTDIVGAAYGHRDAALALDRILGRAASAEARGYPEPDILLLTADYNATVEGSPVILPLIYFFRKNDLGQRWRAYRAAKDS